MSNYYVVDIRTLVFNRYYINSNINNSNCNNIKQLWNTTMDKNSADRWIDYIFDQRCKWHNLRVFSLPNFVGNKCDAT